ncbi:MAG: hypothetical protein ACE5JI_22935, partial [Acidobacteriota bacterium]
MPQYELNFRDYLRIIRKHRYQLIAPPLVLAALTYLLTPTPPVSYKATSSTKISQSSTMAGLLLQVFTYSPGDNIATQTRVLTSLPLMARLAQQLGRIPSEVDFKEMLDRPDYVALLTDLQSRVSAAQAGSTSIVEITAEADSADEAKSIANGLADVFVAWSLEEKNRQVIEAKKFIAEQLAQAESRLKEAEARQQAFLETNLDRLSLSSGEMARLQREREQVLKRITTLTRQIEQLETRRRTPSGHIDWISSSELSDSNLQRFNNELIDLQLQRERLLVYQ